MTLRFGMLGALAALALAGASPASAAAIVGAKYITTLDTTSSAANLPGSAFGTVELDQIPATEVDVLVSLTATETWVGSDSKNTMAWNLSSAAKTASLAVTSPFSYNTKSYNNTTGYSQSPFNNFNSGIDAQSNGALGTHGLLTLKFTYSGGITVDDFITNFSGSGTGAGGGSYYFAVDLGITATGKTGSIAASQKPRRIPEPATAALVAGGLAILGWARRRRA